ncbi:8296_t:CDS:2 [Funneliformis geosporum]|nr:8296_t:CDS:2 [Funneliformis geosporum]
MEFADGGALRNYLKHNFNKLSWGDKSNLASQLACAVSCLHDEGIVHRDLHSGNILIHQGVIKLADFGLSKRIEAATNQLKVFSVIPYVDPKSFIRKYDNTSQQYRLNEKSDVYSVGVLLWELTSGLPPFHDKDEVYDIGLAIEISQGLRESIVSGTPEDYVKIYIDCWDNEPDNRPSMNKVIDELNAIITKANIIDFPTITANADIAKQYALCLAREADPDGLRNERIKRIYIIRNQSSVKSDESDDS